MVISRPIRIPSVGDDDYVAGQKTRAKTHRVEYDCFDVVCFERGAKDGSELVANNKSQADFVTDILRATPRAAPSSSGPTGAPPWNLTQGFRTSRSGHALVSGRSTIRSCNLANCGERKLDRDAVPDYRSLKISDSNLHRSRKGPPKHTEREPTETYDR